MRPIPTLVFSTRSAAPKSGADLVREVVAETPGIEDWVRAEFSRRADLTGTVLEQRLDQPVYTFNRLGESEWLLCRAVSLGLYRKGSNLLLVQGLVLGEEHLDALDGDPLLLDLPAARDACGIEFLAAHPGSGAPLAPLRFRAGVASLARRLAQERLSSLSAAMSDAHMATAYTALAERRRVGLIAATPQPALVEAVLLHLHRDDRLDTAFHTFYAHSRPVDYDLLAAAPQDAQAVRGQFGDLVEVDLQREPAAPAAQSLGRLAVALRRRDTGGYVRAVDDVRLTYRSRRFMPPLDRTDAAIALHAALDGEETLVPTARMRLARLRERRHGGLHGRVMSLARVWREQPERFQEQLADLAASKDSTTRRDVDDLLGAPPAGLDERWCALALFSRDQRLQREPGWTVERLRAWEALLPAEDQSALLAALDGNPEQARTAEPILLDYALANAVVGPQVPPVGVFWDRLLGWLLARPSARVDALARAEAAFARLRGAAAVECWVMLQQLLVETGQSEDALRIFFSHVVSELPPAEATTKAGAAIRFWLHQGAERDDVVASWASAAGLADEVVAQLAAWLPKQRGEAAERAVDRASIVLGSLERLSPASGPACGSLLARLARSHRAEQVPAVVDDLLRGLTTSGDKKREAFLGAALGGAAAELIPALESGGALADAGPLLRAVAVLLAARNRSRVPASADALLLHLAVLGRQWEQTARAYEVADSAATALDLAWVSFLRQTSVLALLREREPERIDESVRTRSRVWLRHLQDEVTVEPTDSAEDDPRLRLFVELAWWRWSGARQESDEAAALCTKLHLTRTLGRNPASSAWLLEMATRVLPQPLHARAYAVMRPRPEPGRSPFGGRG